MSLQNDFLNDIKNNETQVSIFLVNGIKLVGIIKDYDDFIVLLENQENVQLIYKHAISTIVPNNPN